MFCQKHSWLTLPTCNNQTSPSPLLATLTGLQHSDSHWKSPIGWTASIHNVKLCFSKILAMGQLSRHVDMGSTQLNCNLLAAQLDCNLPATYNMNCAILAWLFVGITVALCLNLISLAPPHLTCTIITSPAPLSSHLHLPTHLPPPHLPCIVILLATLSLQQEQGNAMTTTCCIDQC